MTARFGDVLKDWRRQRRLSQLDLGLGANVSARHISFLETGRARPSRTMVLHLCDELAVPRAARNRMLVAAGFAPAYAERDAADPELGPANEALDWMLDQHAPYPALALDRHWRLMRLNRTAAAMLSQLGLTRGDSLLEALLTSTALRSAVENLPEVAFHVRRRLRTELTHFGDDPVLARAIDALEPLAADLPDPLGVLPAAVPARYRFGDRTLNLFSIFAQFGTVEDIALAEIRVELMFPADEATREALLALDAVQTP